MRDVSKVMPSYLLLQKTTTDACNAIILNRKSFQIQNTLFYVILFFFSNTFWAFTPVMNKNLKAVLVNVAYLLPQLKCIIHNLTVLAFSAIFFYTCKNSMICLFLMHFHFKYNFTKLLSIINEKQKNYGLLMAGSTCTGILSESISVVDKHKTEDISQV